MTETEGITRTAAAVAAFCLTAIALAALFLPLFGPLLDHHFAERQPGHGHVYFGSAVADHSHPYEVSRLSRHHHHVHPPSDGTANAVAGGDEASFAGIVYLAACDGSSPGFHTQATPILPQPPLFLDLEPPGFIRGGAQDEAALRDAYVTPPRRPPRI